MEFWELTEVKKRHLGISRIILNNRKIKQSNLGDAKLIDLTDLMTVETRNY